MVFAGLIGGGKLFDSTAVVASGVAFAVFCVLSGVVYLINDVRDREADRLHPVKSRRPIASGALTPGAALRPPRSSAAWRWPSRSGCRRRSASIAAVYLALLSVYSTSLKHVVILDVLTIAVGFVLRAAGGAAAVAVPISHWLLLLTLLLALFLGLSKRRAELVLAGRRRA